MSAVFVAALLFTAPAESREVRVDDRTLVCVTRVVAGARKFSVSFSPVSPPSMTTPDGFPAGASVASGFQGDVSATLVFASAGPGARLARPRIDPERCNRTSTRVALSSRGLPGPPVRFQQRADCKLPGRILVRVRVVSTGSRVTRADLVVRMERSQAPISYARISESGSGAFWVSPRCD